MDQNIGVIEPQNPVALRDEPRVADSVMGIVLMLRTVGLDDQHLFAAQEVGEIFADRHLSDEFVAVERSVPQGGPEKIFGVGRISPEISRSCIGSGFAAAHCHGMRYAREDGKRRDTPHPAVGHLLPALRAGRSGISEASSFTPLRPFPGVA